MTATVKIGDSDFSIPGVDHLEVEGELVMLQRGTATGYETVAVVGEDLVVRLEEEPPKAEAAPVPTWHPVGEPIELYEGVAALD